MRNPKFLGVYSLKTASANGQRPKFFVWSLPDGNYAIQGLDATLSQRGPARSVSAQDMDRAFRAEPSILAAPITTPDFRSITSISTGAKAQPERAEQNAPPEEPVDATELESTLRDNFTKALRDLRRPQNKKNALAMLERIIKTKKGIEPSHKHMFRDFGVALRKRSQLELALLAAQRAVKLSPNDDHAHFNLARILGILGRYREAQSQLDSARAIAPKEHVYALLANHLEKEKNLADSQGMDYDF